MSVAKIKEMGHSVNARLKHLSETSGINFDYLILRYACERFLFRLGQSRHSRNFILKGASAFSVWFGPTFRVTRDTDLLCHGAPAPEHIVQCFREICSLEVPEDGVRFDTTSIVTSEIKKDAKYRGTRVVFNAWIQNARAVLQFDVGFGDFVYPAPVFEKYPRLLEAFQAPNILVYPRCTVVAEKFEAIVSRGMLNSRLKDYFDLWLLSEDFDFDYGELETALDGSFRRRETTIPCTLPIGLSEAFVSDIIKQSQWRAFLKKVAPSRKPASLQAAVERIAVFLQPFIFRSTPSPNKWEAGRGWMPV